jgi:replicative DNA helicase
MMNGAMYLLGAMSGGGKTTFLQAVAVETSMSGDVLFVSPEMGMDELAEREIMRRSGFSIFDVGPWIRPDDRALAQRAHKAAADSIISEGLPVHILENIEATMTEIMDESRKFKNLRLVIIDYAQEIADMDSKLARYLAVGEVGKDAIKLGRECKCPVMIASQLNQKNEKGRVEYSFRESGKLFHKANTAMIIDVKRQATANRNGFFDIESTKIFSMKNRGGPMFSVDVDYRPSIYRFSDVGKSNEQWAPMERNNADY